MGQLSLEPRGTEGERPRSWSHSGGPGERVGLMQEDPQLYHAVRSLTNVSHSSLLASHTAAQSTQAFWLPLLRGSSPTTTTTAGRMQAEKHRSALPCRLRSTAPRCPQVPFRRQALSQETASRSTSHDREATVVALASSSVPSACDPSRDPVAEVQGWILPDSQRRRFFGGGGCRGSASQETIGS